MATLTGDKASMLAGGTGWNVEVFTVAQQPLLQYTLQEEPQVDDDGDSILVVKLNGVTATKGSDYTINGTIITWVSQIDLEHNDILEILYQKQ
jgi:hypothetical protein